MPLTNPPDPPFRCPSDRHRVQKVRQKTAAKDRNTVVLPSVDMRADCEAINRGEGEFNKQNAEYALAGRVYSVHGEELPLVLFPVRGDGFFPLSRGAFKALGVLNDVEDRARAIEIMDRMEIEQAERDQAMQVWELGRLG
ncbi:hypothetical protein [Armatimonas sp.]|uniref:hypothetical protein n=1 Tax=Armatimonas sp. TaxID=1872638 RepID=UPI00374DB2A9